MNVSRRLLARHIATELRSGKNRSATIQSLAAYVVTHRLKSQVSLIVADVAANLAELGHIEATVTSARPLEASLKQDIADYVKRMEDADTVALVEEIDPTIIGGVIIETPKKRFDASIRTKLKRLKNA